ncbi:MAG: UDP-N-acetylglucosamine--N-acetylmuramyl-(pentapeptide) pyrophosphoryl-undecaprenol N-acetylglucosamine transferase [Anaerolineales bacterium]|nr:MAG: UDP-N-acetylglucosamine--N-acetylmuramyl-(pentapeptide) pyrophosphoryl-undecaprenol N-acetylglucosamine transferase [Anaerolineales bacterium]
MYPALAVLNALADEKRDQLDDDIHPGGDLQVLWVGSVGGMETDLVKREGVPFEAIPAAGVHGVGWRTLPGNLIQLARGFLAARRILKKFKPEVMFFTGGFVAVPMAIASMLTYKNRSRPRSLVYVPDIEPALALKTVSRFADRIAITVDETRAYMKLRSKMVVTGYPVRADLQKWDRERALRTLQLSPGLPTVFIFGGSKGSRSINQAVQKILPDLLREMQVIHISGTLDWQDIQVSQKLLFQRAGSEAFQRYKVYPYMHSEMGAAFTVADLVVCRAGASTLGELPLFGVPAILVPYPYAWRYQQVNAQYLAERGAALVLQDAKVSTDLLPLIRDLIHNREKLSAMRTAMSGLVQPEAAKNIAGELRALASTIGGSL